MLVFPEVNYCISWVVSLLISLKRPYSKLEIKILLKCVPIFCIILILRKGKKFDPIAKSSDQLSGSVNLPIQWVSWLLRRRKNEGS
jgi:hypothetical protein